MLNIIVENGIVFCGWIKVRIGLIKVLLLNFSVLIIVVVVFDFFLNCMRINEFVLFVIIFKFIINGVMVVMMKYSDKCIILNNNNVLLVIKLMLRLINKSLWEFKCGIKCVFIKLLNIKVNMLKVNSILNNCLFILKKLRYI